MEKQSLALWRCVRVCIVYGNAQAATSKFRCAKRYFPNALLDAFIIIIIVICVRSVQHCAVCNE